MLQNSDQSDGVVEWECRKCGFNNKVSSSSCAKCLLDKYTAITMSMKRRKYCDDCGHLHLDGNFCHMFVDQNSAYDVTDDFMDEESEAADNADTEGDDDDSDIEDAIDVDVREEDEEEEDDDSIFGKSPAKKLLQIEKEQEKEVKSNSDNMDLIVPIGIPPKAVKPKMMPLETPIDILQSGLVRCNCRIGVPFKSRRFLPFPKIYRVGEIVIRTYKKIISSQEKDAQLQQNKIDENTKLSDGKIKDEKSSISALKSTISTTGFFQPPPYSTEYTQLVVSVLTDVLTYVPAGSCGVLAAISRHWYSVAICKQDYMDLRNFKPITVYKIHRNSVDSVYLQSDKLYTGGDKSVVVTDALNGELINTVMKDSGDVLGLTPHDNNLYVSSGSGSIRAFTFTFSGTKMESVRSFVLHSKAVNGLLFSLPSSGYCEAHGMKNHVCYMYSASKDRTLHVWDTIDGKVRNTLSPPTLRECSFSSIAQSERHLFLGTTGASVMVFSTGACERLDLHLCSMPGATQIRCLQNTLKLPPRLTVSGNLPTVTHLLCSEAGLRNHRTSHLWAADNTGYLTVWKLPGDTGISFAPLNSWRLHTGAINGMISTGNSVITISDDGILIVTHIWKFHILKYLDINEICYEKGLYPDKYQIKRKLKCVNCSTDLSENSIGVRLSTCEKIMQDFGVVSILNAASFIGGILDEQNTKYEKTSLNPLLNNAQTIRNNGSLVIGTNCGEVIFLPVGCTV